MGQSLGTVPWDSAHGWDSGPKKDPAGAGGAIGMNKRHGGRGVCSARQVAISRTTVDFCATVCRTLRVPSWHQICSVPDGNVAPSPVVVNHGAVRQNSVRRPNPRPISSSSRRTQASVCSLLRATAAKDADLVSEAAAKRTRAPEGEERGHRLQAQGEAPALVGTAPRFLHSTPTSGCCRVVAHHDRMTHAANVDSFLSRFRGYRPLGRSEAPLAPSPASAGFSFGTDCMPRAFPT